MVQGQCGVVRLHYGVRHSRGGEDGESVDDLVWQLLSNLIDDEAAEARACTSPEAVKELEALQTVAGLHLPPGHVHQAVGQLRPVSVET